MRLNRSLATSSLALSVAALVLGAAVPTASALLAGQRRPVETTIRSEQPTFGPGGVVFAGRVRAADQRCVVDRRVVLRSTDTSGQPIVLGADRAARSGRFSITLAFGDVMDTDGVFALTTKRERRGGAPSVVCTGAKATVQVL